MTETLTEEQMDGHHDAMVEAVRAEHGDKVAKAVSEVATAEIGCQVVRKQLPASAVEALDAHIEAVASSAVAVVSEYIGEEGVFDE